MPVRTESEFDPSVWLRSGHLNTIYSGLLRTVERPDYVEERVEVPDGDFVDVAWARQGSSRLAVLCHGLEGNAYRTYMTGMARGLLGAGWDVLTWNYRGCSGEPNRFARSYHSGHTDDLRYLLTRARPDYDVLAAVGFSLGGNMVLKYLGEEGDRALADMAAALSVPCDLAASSAYLERPAARLYMSRFMRTLKPKVREKARLFPGEVPLDGLDAMRTFRDFDNVYTGPLNGFRDADDYWARCSSKAFLADIRRPTLILNAQDDPFLPPACFPVRAATESRQVTLEMPRHGGHVGYAESRTAVWSEQRVPAYFAEVLGEKSPV